VSDPSVPTTIVENIGCTLSAVGFVWSVIAAGPTTQATLTRTGGARTD
jgi:hypothetical protein